ncbi:DNA cytosine methyltransferase [Maritalea sp.]|jgi:DNA (cytosine-5)-methyltransferase 1|uniref:DNA cytosine methyltransferase n=1 Tax=Maritalea sp. TaxID=2003361 RepID=UPI0039E65F94
MNRAVRPSELENEYLSFLGRQRIPLKKLGLSYASVFCGGGGLDLGFSLAGFTPAFSSDLVSHYCDTLADNLGKGGHVVEPHDISNLTGAHVRNVTGRELDIVIGGPPCQSFSILGSRGSTGDPRGQLVFDYARFIRELAPRAFLFENVPGIMTLNKGADWEQLVSCFKDETGFYLRTGVLNAADYGVPQFRQRVLLIGFKNRDAANSFNWPTPTHGKPPADELRPYRTASQALQNVEGVPNHILRKHGQRVRDRYSLVEQGSRDRKDHTDRIHAERPSGTVLVGSGAGGGRPFIHPTEHRHITVREAARLQSFPDWWVFSGGATAAYRQVGNAVPPLLAKAVAKEIAKVL